MFIFIFCFLLNIHLNPEAASLHERFNTNIIIITTAAGKNPTSTTKKSCFLHVVVTEGSVASLWSRRVGASCVHTCLYEDRDVSFIIFIKGQSSNTLSQ